VKDRVRSELDFDVNLRAETEIQALSHRMSLLLDKIEDVESLVRESSHLQAETETQSNAAETERG